MKGDTIKCVICGTEFIAKTKKSRACSKAHAVKAFMQDRPGYKDANSDAWAKNNPDKVAGFQRNWRAKNADRNAENQARAHKNAKLKKRQLTGGLMLEELTRGVMEEIGDVFAKIKESGAEISFFFDKEGSFGTEPNEWCVTGYKDPVGAGDDTSDEVFNSHTSLLEALRMTLKELGIEEKQ